MPFEKVETQNVDFPALERAALKFWDEHRIFDKLRAKNADKPKWSFLDGPITANNPMGVHHAWGRTYKDAYNRYFAMTGRHLRYQQGFDCQGLWVEVEVEKELGLKSKRDIENLVPGDPEASVAKFVQACKDRAGANGPEHPPRVLDGLGPHGRGLGQDPGRAEVVLHDGREE